MDVREKVARAIFDQVFKSHTGLDPADVDWEQIAKNEYLAQADAALSDMAGGAERYWEARYRDEAAANDAMREALAKADEAIEKLPQALLDSQTDDNADFALGRLYTVHDDIRAALKKANGET